MSLGLPCIETHHADTTKPPGEEEKKILCFWLFHMHYRASQREVHVGKGDTTAKHNRQKEGHDKISH